MCFISDKINNGSDVIESLFLIVFNDGFDVKSHCDSHQQEFGNDRSEFHENDL